MKKIIITLLCLVFFLNLVSCHRSRNPNEILVGTISGPETRLMEVAQQIAAKKYNLNVKVVSFSDYNIPNEALNDGSIDANAFQHKPFLESQIQARNYKIVAIGKTFLYPMGLYSKKITTLADIKPGDKVAVPNDPSNEARALLLLHIAKLLKLRHGAGVNATLLDITSNPKNLKFVELDAAQLPRALNDVTLAAINTNYAIPAGLSPATDALLTESKDSPYANIIVVRTADRNNPNLLNFVKAFHSQEMINEAKQLFGDAAIPAWK